MFLFGWKLDMKDFIIVWLSEKQHMKSVLVQTAFWDIDAA